MNQEERQVITDIFERLRQVADQPRDPEAERLVAEKVRQQPYAPYALAQAVYVQEQAVANLDAEVQQLRGEVERLRRQPQGGGGFLSSIFGGGSQQSDSQQEGSPSSRPGRSLPGYGAREGVPAAGPWGGTAGPAGAGAMQSRGGGFLQNALATAAGVAGGVMIANALSNAFGGSEKASTNSLAGSGTEGAGETGGITDSLYQDASAKDADPGDDLGDFGGDAGDGGDWT